MTTCARPARGCAAPDVTLLNQSVLLRGVNDDVDTLADLSRACSTPASLLTTCICPTACAARRISTCPRPRPSGSSLALTARLSGYLVPRLVREVPGAASKVPSAPLTEAIR